MYKFQGIYTKIPGMNKFRKVARFKIGIQKSILFLYISNKHVEKPQLKIKYRLNLLQKRERNTEV